LYLITNSSATAHLASPPTSAEPTSARGFIFATMKILAFIFSFYILFLSTVPCCAFDNCKDEAQQTQTADGHKHHDGCKNCSPFNQCGNCVGFTFSPNAFQVDKPQQLNQQKSSVKTQSILSKYFSSFWQPPRLS